MTTNKKSIETEDLNKFFSKDVLTQAFKRAVWNGYAETAEFLLDHGVEIPEERAWGGGRYNPLKLAAQRGHYGLAKKLLERGLGKEWSRGVTVWSVYSGNTDLLKLCLDWELADEEELGEARNAAITRGYADCFIPLETALAQARRQAHRDPTAPAP